MIPETILQRLEVALSECDKGARLTMLSDGRRMAWVDRDDLSNVLASQPEGWQPIASAPKDGTWILMLDGNLDYEVASWRNDDWCNEYQIVHKPKYWRPLPPAPTDAQGK